MIGPLGIWGHLDSLPARAARQYAERVEELGYDALWVPETVGREPFTLLATLATATRTLILGTSIASIWARDAQTMRMCAFTLQEMSEGRFVLGLGVSHAHLAEKLHGHRYERPLRRMREYLDAYHAARYRGPAHAPEPEPPLVLAALRDGMLRLAATATRGAFPYLVTEDRVAAVRALLDAGIAAAGRPWLLVTLPVILERDASAARASARAYLAPYLRTPNYQASWELQGFHAEDWLQPGSDRLVDGMTAWGNTPQIRARIDALRAAGADHVALIPLARDGTTEHLETVEALAPA